MKRTAVLLVEAKNGEEGENFRLTQNLPCSFIDLKRSTLETMVTNHYMRHNTIIRLPSDVAILTIVTDTMTMIIARFGGANAILSSLLPVNLVLF